MSTAAAHPSVDQAGREGYPLPNVDSLRVKEGVAPMPDIQRILDAIKVKDDWAVHAAEALLKAALEAGCSDLHLSSLRDELLVRGRREGTLFELAHIAPEHRELLIARMKVLAHVPTFVRHEPQDGRIEWHVADGQPPMIFRASFLPTLHGESVVIRLPERRESRRLGLDDLGLPESVREALLSLLARREGVVVLTGPSSSGKTTTMYAMLERLHTMHGDRVNVLTIEDPVERDLGFASQVQINNAQGLTFEKALRAAVRQDPNVLMVGEVRDAETARTVVQAGMSGHLVMTTMHAGRASRVFTRLLSMGMEPYLVGSSLCGAIAQRLVRKLCVSCRGAGCAECNQTGSSGRMGLFEVVGVTERLRELMLAKASASDIAAEAARNMLGDLLTQGRQMVADGQISEAEFQFVLSGEESEP
jgi:general secretion pathway protein E